MSFQAMTWAVEQRVPAMQKLVLLMLANRTNHETGKCIPRIKLLADECGMSETACKSALKALSDSGHISIEERFEDGLRKPNQYTLNLHRASNEGVGRQTTDGRREATGGGSPDDPGVGRQTPTEPGSIEPVIEPKNLSGYPPEFEAVWREYPKRAGGNSKADAFKAWTARVKAGVLPVRMLEGVRRYAGFLAATDKTGTEFVKQAATFFGPALHFDEPWAPPPKKGTGRGTLNQLMCPPAEDYADDLFGERTGT